ncbi:MAG: riboflavin synthase [Deltaproteobacteria bacterium]|nr:riboflavin synthase [Deltaproteobacteria bacterium]
MFTGIIEGIGSISKIIKKGGGMLASVNTDISLTSVKIGDSIAVNGVCLTASAIKEKSFQAYVSPETRQKTTFGEIMPGTPVNIERALRLSDRLNGHIVSGHIDDTAILNKKEQKDDAIILTFSVGKEITKYIIKKGSVAIDGISLTINNCSNNSFDVSIIPHTAQETTLQYKKQGDKVNIETDIIGKYINKLITGTNSDNTKSDITMNFLSETGFLNT